MINGPGVYYYYYYHHLILLIDVAFFIRIPRYIVIAIAITIIIVINTICLLYSSRVVCRMSYDRNAHIVACDAVPVKSI